MCYVLGFHIQNFANQVTITSYITREDEIVHDSEKDDKQDSEGEDGHEGEESDSDRDEEFAEAERSELGGGEGPSMSSNMQEGSSSAGSAGRVESTESATGAVSVALIAETNEHVPEPSKLICLVYTRATECDRLPQGRTPAAGVSGVGPEIGAISEAPVAEIEERLDKHTSEHGEQDGHASL